MLHNLCALGLVILFAAAAQAQPREITVSYNLGSFPVCPQGTTAAKILCYDHVAVIPGSTTLAGALAAVPLGTAALPVGATGMLSQIPIAFAFPFGDVAVIMIARDASSKPISSDPAKCIVSYSPSPPNIVSAK